MSDPIDATLHGKALLAFGFDLASLRQGMELPGVRWFLSGFTRAREALGTLVLTASLSMERAVLWPPWANATKESTLWAMTAWSGNIHQGPTVA